MLIHSFGARLLRTLLRQPYLTSSKLQRFAFFHIVFLENDLKIFREMGLMVLLVLVGGAAWMQQRYKAVKMDIMIVIKCSELFSWRHSCVETPNKLSQKCMELD